MMLSPPSRMGDQGDQTFAPLLFSLQPADAGVSTPRASSVSQPLGGSSRRTASKTTMSIGSVHVEQSPMAPPPPVDRLMKDIAMEDVSTPNQQQVPPPLFSFSAAGFSDQQAPPQLGQTLAPQYDDVWVTVYGFNQGDLPLVLKEFAHCGDILEWGAYGATQANFIHIQYQNKYAAQRALLRDGEQLNSNLIIGVKPVDVRHRAAIATHDSTESNVLEVRRPAIEIERPYRLEQSAVTQQIPQPAHSFVSKIAQFVLGV